MCCVVCVHVYIIKYASNWSVGIDKEVYGF